MKWDLVKKHESRLAKTVEDRAELALWKEELLPKLKAVTEGTEIVPKIEMLSEALMMFAGQLAHDTAIKTKALATIMKNRHGVTDEEILKWQNGDNLIPPTTSQLLEK